MIESRDDTLLEEAVNQLRRAASVEPDNPMAWRLLGQAYSSLGREGEARLASAEYYYAIGEDDQSVQMALRARDMLDPGTIEWRRAVDIVLASGATLDDLEALDRSQARDN